MQSTAFLDDLQQRVSALFAGTPAADLQRNLKAMLAQQFGRLELATREEFDTQAQVLARTRAKLEALERRVAELEAGRSIGPSPQPSPARGEGEVGAAGPR